MSDDEPQHFRPPTPDPAALAAVSRPYVNATGIEVSPYDFAINFLQTSTSGTLPVARVVMSPLHAKVLSVMLAHNVEVYEKTIGPIEVKEGFIPAYDKVRKP